MPLTERCSNILSQGANLNLPVVVYLEIGDISMSVDFDQLYERYIIGPHKVDPPELRSVLQRIVVESTQVETERAVLKELLLELANFLNLVYQ